MRLSALALLLVCATAVPARAADQHIFKIATLAPEGSTWWKVFKETDKRLRDASGDRLGLKLYAGGVAGDEPDFVRKMRVGQLQAAAVTSVGLAEIQPAMLVLQAPGLFKNWAELDYARNKMSDRFRQLLADKGFEVLLWGDVGFNRPFGTTPIKTPADLKNLKPWCWTQDAVYQAFYSAAGATPVLLGVPDVLPGLQTGLINGFSTPPLVAVSLQWFNKVKYMLDLPVSVTIGAVLVTKKEMDKLSPEDKAIIKKVADEMAPKLAQAVRADNDSSVEALKKAGIQVQAPDPAAQAAWDKVFVEAGDAAAGKVYPAELLKEVRDAVAAQRAGK